MDRCLAEQLKEQLNDLKLELFDVSRSILALTKDTTVQTEEENRISRGIFEACVFIRRMLSMPPPVAEPMVVSTAPTIPTIKEGGIRLPRIEVPKFDGNIMNWKTFWEQYSVSIDSKPRLSDPEKLTYLRQALKDRQAKDVIEGLSGSGDDYKDGMEYLRGQYDKPCLIHREHVRSIVETSSLKEGMGKSYDNFMMCLVCIFVH